MNKNIKERDEIIFGTYDKDTYMGGARHFRYMNVDTLKKLINKGYIELDECQNCSPSTREFFDFMQEYPAFTAHGYAIIDTRDDYRVTIEGIECDRLDDVTSNIEALKDFVRLARFANEFDIDDGFYCWWD